jgi:PAS domain S-box-containing protein
VDNRSRGQLLKEREVLQGRVDRLESANFALRRLSVAPDLESLGEVFEACVRGTIPFDITSVSLLRGEQEWEHLQTGEVVTAPGPIGEAGSATDWVVKHREPLFRRDILEDSRFRVSDRTRESGIRSDIIIPLISRGEVVGTLSVASTTPGAYEDHHLEFLLPLADQIAVTADNRQLYRELNEAYRDLKMIYDRASDLICLIRVEDDGSLVFASVNQTFLQTTGLSESAIVNKSPGDVLEVDTARAVVEEANAAIQKGIPGQITITLEAHGASSNLELALTPVIDDTGTCTHLLGVAVDVSRRLQSEREIIRLERLHALEEMARGVAHNFNNILVGVLGYAQLIEMQSNDENAKENAKEIIESALRAKDLVQRLNLSVGRGNDIPPHKIDNFNTIVQQVIEDTSPRWKDEAEVDGITIQVETEFHDVPPVVADPVGLHHILVHLITNAADALVEGGTIKISTGQREQMVQLKVEDNGVGMSEETQKRIFDPFFTTRQDVGSGLGLSMAYRTVTSWDGAIEVNSSPGAGSEFVILLPIWTDEAEGEKEQSGEARVLVVDDEHTVRQVLSKALNMYQLDVFSNPEDAMEVFTRGRYAVALIDLGIPGKPGDQLTRELKEVDPDLVAVLVTGWEVLNGDPRLEPFDFHIQKPFGLIEIQELVSKGVGRWQASRQ